MTYRYLFFLSFLLVQVCFTRAAVYYVSTNGLPGNPGTIAQPWSILHAFVTAQANDTVWIKAGNYGNVNLTIANSGTTFIGYTNIPGDINQSTLPDSLNTFLQNNYDTVLPTLDGANRATAGTAIDFVTWKTKVVLKNFQIRNYQFAVSVVGYNHLIENVVTYELGNYNLFYDGWGIVVYGHNNTIKNAFVLNAAAEGIAIKGDSNLAQKCKVYCNDTIHAFEQGNPSTQYGDTDYYIYISANSATKQGKFNIIEDCYLERVSRTLAHIGHSGHGFCLTISYNHKPCDLGGGYCYDSTQKWLVVENNIIRHCRTKNIGESVMLRGDKVRNNLIENVVSLSYGSLVILNSSRFNTFNRCHIKNSYYWKDPNSSSIYRKAGVELCASHYGDSTAQNISDPESNSYPWEVNLAASYNTFTNCIFENVAAGVTLHNYSEFYYPSYHPLAGQPIDRLNRKKIVGNHFINCTFIAKETDTITMLSVNRPSFMLAMRGSANNSFTNCIIQGFYNFESRSFASNTQQLTIDRHGIVPSMHSYFNCLFYKNSFDAQIPYNGQLFPVGNPPIVPGSNNIVGGYFSQCYVSDPLFVDYANKDFHLTPQSPCVDYGITVSVYDDFDGNQRPCGDWHDIGAYEYQNCNTFVNENSSSVHDLQIFPNPSSEIFSINSPKPIKQIYVYSAIGNLLYSEHLYGQFTAQWNAKEIDRGIYIIQILQENNQIISRKIVKK